MTKRILLPVIAFSALLFNACGDKGDDVSYDVIAPGDECIHGGLRVTVNDEIFVTCNGDSDTSITTEFVNYGEDGNPCVGSAMRMTIQVKGEAPTVAWNCNAPSENDLANVDPDVLGLFISESGLPANDEEVEQIFLCDDNVPQEIVDQSKSSVKHTLYCAAQILAQATISEQVRPAVRCLADRDAERRRCNAINEREDGTPIDLCEEDNFAEADACLATLPTREECYDLVEDDALDELDILGSVYFLRVYTTCDEPFMPL